MKLLCAALLVTLSISSSFAQRQGNLWFFGDSAALDFNSGTPMPITTGVLNTNEGSASIADKTTGSLLFYTDGVAVYNKNNAIMLNGHGLGGTTTSTQSALIVPQPESNTIYYIFTVDAQAGKLGGGSGGLNYNIIDMTKNGGLGQVTTRNKLLLTPTTEKLAGTMACNDTDVWVMVHQWNTDAFYAYLITKTGIGAPVISHTGIVHKDVGSGQNQEAIGYMKFSPNGKRVALACYADLNTVQIFDFDNSSGTVSNPITDTDFVNLSGFDGPYGVSFSPDNSKLYVSYGAASPLFNQVYQYNLLAGNDSEIVASRTSVDSSISSTFGALQNGVDGRLYVVKYEDSYMDVIYNPNDLGASCNYNPDDLYLGSGNNQGLSGLPNIIENYLTPKFSGNLSYTACSKTTTLSFVDSTIGTGATCLWNFGDTASHSSDTSTLQSPMHSFSKPGAYSVTLILTAPCKAKADTIIKTVNVDTVLLTVSPQSPSICGGLSVTLTASGAATYKWSPATGLNTTSGSSVISTPTLTTTYTITGTSGGCKGMDTDVVTLLATPNKPTISISGDSLISSATQGNQWYFNDTLIVGATNQVYVITGSRKGEYEVNVINPANGCSATSDSTTGINQLASISEQVSIYPNPTTGNIFIMVTRSVQDVKDWNLQLTDVVGRLLYSMPALNYNNEIDLSNLPVGVYFITIISRTGQGVFQAVKQN